MKRNFLIGVLSLALLLVFSGASFAQFGSISGRVTDDSTGLPIMGAHVWAKADTTQPGGYGFDFTDSSGYYMIDSLYAGEFLVFANAQGYVEESYPESVTVVAGGNTPDIDFALTSTGSPEYGSISGWVSDDQTGLPIIMAHIEAIGLDNRCVGEAWSDSNGYYIIEDLCAGIWQVQASKTGYYTQTYPDSVSVMEGQTTPGIDFALTPTESPEYGSISGRVTDQVTGLPLVYAHLVATGVDTYCFGEAWSDSGGYYILEDLCVGIWQVEASKPGYYSQIYPDTVSVVEGQTTPDINFALTPFGSPDFGSISGRVTDEVSGYPIQGAAITLSGLYGVWYTDSTGHYLCDSIPIGGYWVTAYATGYQQETYPESVIVFEGQNTPDIDFALAPAGETGSISGQVTDEETGLPLPMAHVLAYDSTHLEGDAWTDTAGLYLMQNLRAGQYIVAVHKDGYQDEVYPESVIVQEGENTPDINFALTLTGSPEYGSISGQVSDDQTGLPIIMAHMEAIGLDNRCVGEAWSDSNGYYIVEDLCVGIWLVQASKPGYYTQVYPDTVSVVEGQNTPDINFTLTPTGSPEYGSISGRVIDQVTSLPIMGAHLVATGLDTYCFGEAWSDSNGYYIVEDLCVGIWQVRASKPGYYAQVYPDTLSVLEGQTIPDIDFALTPILENGSISGRVGDEQTGLPLIEAHLVATGLDNYCFGEAWSDTGGNYTILDLCPGTYQVRVCYTGYVPEIYPESVIVESAQNTYPVNFDLLPNENPGSISGEVTDQITSNPIEGVHVIGVDINSWCIAHAWTNSYGNYILQGLWPGTWVVRGEKHGYFPGVYPDSLILVEGQDAPDIDFALTPEGGPTEYGSISGRVTDEETGLPIVMAEITITGLYCIWYTDTSGFYWCDSLPPDFYEVNARKDGYIPETYPDSVIVVAGENSPNIDFALTTTAELGSISGMVTDEETGLPIVMAHLVATGLDNWCFAEAWSDTGGFYAIQGVCPGIYSVSVNHEGYAQETYPESVIVAAGQNTPGIDFALTPVVYGDADGDGTLHLTDVVYLINYLLKTGPAPSYPLEACDVNCDRELDVSDVVFLIAYLFKGGPEPSCYPGGTLIDFTGCKTFERGTLADSVPIPSDQDCIEYEYDGESVLLIRHVNAAFNCCPTDILADISIYESLITIAESEYLVIPCDCLCLFDVHVKITNVEPGQYTIKVIELYLQPDDEPLEFTIDLSSSPSSGSYCVERDHYPWGAW